MAIFLVIASFSLILVNDHFLRLTLFFNRCGNSCAGYGRASDLQFAVVHNQYLICLLYTSQNGDIVVALLEDSATVKRFYREDGHYRLQPENDYMDPIIVDHVDIQGKVIGLFRRMK